MSTSMPPAPAGAAIEIVAVVVAVGLALTGCTARRTPTAGPSPSQGLTPVSALPGASAAAPPASAPGTGSSQPAASSAQRCHTRDLTGHVEGHGAGAGQRYAALGLTNLTHTACTVYGYPGLQLFDANGSALPTVTRRDQAVAPKLLSVAPGQTVWTQLHWTVTPADNEAATHCAPDPVTLRVIPPDETTQLTMTFEYGPVCQHGEISVAAFGLDRPADG